MDVVVTPWESVRRLAWHVGVGFAMAGACLPGGLDAYESVIRLRDEGPGRSRFSIRREAADGIAAIEAYLADQARGTR